MVFGFDKDVLQIAVPYIVETGRNSITQGNLDCQICGARDLSGAFTMVNSKSALDLIMLDLPDCEHIDSLVRFRERCPNVPIIAISADHAKDTIHAALQAEAVGYIPKSLNPKSSMAMTTGIAVIFPYREFE